jgi:pimeloyl-ACP methyl ester carboxylesterase
MNILKTITVLAVAVTSTSCAARGVGEGVSDLPPAPLAPVEQEVSLTTPTGVIAGTMYLPAARSPVPVVLIVAGSGPTDRNGNSAALPGANNSLRLLASGLAAQGIASLRYDKRGIAASRSAGSKEEDLRFEHYVSDAAGWVAQLHGDPRFSTITIAGHSEGSLIGMLATREANADGFVSIAGVGRKATDILREQLSAQVSPAVLAQIDAIVAKIEKGEKPDSVPPSLNALFRPSVQPYLTSWFALDPSIEIAKLDVPVLIIQGSTDVQVKVEDANRLGSAKPGAKVVIVEGMNHVLKTAQGSIAQQMPSYSDPDLPVVPQVLTEIGGFVKGLRARSGSADHGEAGGNDSLLGIDKLKHFLLSGFVEGVAFAGLQAAGTGRSASLAGAGATAAMVAVGREVHDRRVTGLFSVGDLLWDAVGAGAAFLIVSRIDR